MVRRGKKSGNTNNKNAEFVIKNNELSGSYTLMQTQNITLPQPDGVTVCSNKDLRRTHTALLKIKEEAAKSTGLWVDICAAVFGVALGYLITLLSEQNILTYRGLAAVIIFLISFFAWLWFKRRPNISIDQHIENVLELLPFERAEDEKDKI